MTIATVEQLPATQALRHSPIPALRRLDLEETDSAVVITGRVTSYYLKQLAQETILPVLAGRELRNHVNVIRETAPTVS
jgi:hypothetical protein